MKMRIPRLPKMRLRDQLLTLGILGAAVAEFVHDCDKGKHPLEAGKHAWDRAKARAELLSDKKSRT